MDPKRSARVLAGFAEHVDQHLAAGVHDRRMLRNRLRAAKITGYLHDFCDILKTHCLIERIQAIQRGQGRRFLTFLDRPVIADTSFVELLAAGERQVARNICNRAVHFHADERTFGRRGRRGLKAVERFQRFKLVAIHERNSSNRYCGLRNKRATSHAARRLYVCALSDPSPQIHLLDKILRTGDFAVRLLNGLRRLPVHQKAEQRFILRGKRIIN